MELHEKQQNHFIESKLYHTNEKKSNVQGQAYDDSRSFYFTYIVQQKEGY